AANITDGTAQSFKYQDDNAVDVGAVTVVGSTLNGITTSAGGGDVSVTAVRGELTLSKANAAGNRDVGLTAAAGAVMENAGGLVPANCLAVTAKNASALPFPYTTLFRSAANITDGTAQSFKYQDDNGVDVGAVTVVGSTLNGITTSAGGGDVSVTAV